MSAHDSFMADAASFLLDFQGRSGGAVVYRPKPGGTATTFALAGVGPETRREFTDEHGGRKLERRRPVTVPASELASPKVQGEVDFGGETWAVRGDASVGGGLTRFEIVIVQAVEVSAARLYPRR